VKKENQGKALDDKLRLELARKLHITDLDYTINNDLKELYDIWKESDPDHIPDMDIKKITIAIREIYDPLFYVKNSKAKSTLHPEAPQKNVRAAYGVSIDMKKVSAFKKHQESKNRRTCFIIFCVTKHKRRSRYERRGCLLRRRITVVPRLSSVS